MKENELNFFFVGFTAVTLHIAAAVAYAFFILGSNQFAISKEFKQFKAPMDSRFHLKTF